MSDTSGGWFLSHGDGEVHGPFDLATLVEAARKGNISSVTQLRHEAATQGQWLLATRIRPIAQVLGQLEQADDRPPVTQAASETGKEASAKAPPAKTSGKPKEPRDVTTETKANRSEPDSLRTARTEAEVDRLDDAVGDVPGPDLGVSVRKSQRLGRGKDSLIVPETFGAACLALFDFRFRYFITPWIIKFTWGICVVVAVLTFLVATVGYVIQPLVSSAETELSSNRGLVSDEAVGSPPRSRGAWEFQPPPFLAENLGRIMVYIALTLFYGLGLLYLRMLLEAAIVIFRIATDLSELKEFFRET